MVGGTSRALAPNLSGSRRGTLLIHPVAIAAVAVLLLNDHVLKAAFPGFVTGKLSDVAGLVFFPLLLAEAVAACLRRDPKQLVPPTAALTALCFALVKLTTAGAAMFALTIGAAQWIVALAVTGHGNLRAVAVAMDATDLIALPAVVIAVAIARRSSSGRSLRLVARSARRARFAPIAMGLLMAAATMATTAAPPPPTGVVVSEQLGLAAGEVAVRHVTWSVDSIPSASTLLRLEVSTRAGAQKDPNSSPSAVGLYVGPEPGSVEPIRIVPDDARLTAAVRRDGFEFEFTTVTLDLGQACVHRCSGGARIFVSSLVGLLVVRLTTGSPPDNPALSLRADGVGDYTGTIALADSGAQEAQIELDHVRTSWRGGYTLHVAAMALQDPYANLRLILRTTVAGVDDKAGLDASASLSIDGLAGSIDLGGSARWHVIDLADRCARATACDIPIELEVIGVQPSPPGPTPGAGVDVYRWKVGLELMAFDGRSLPADAVWVTRAQP